MGVANAFMQFFASSQPSRAQRLLRANQKTMQEKSRKIVRVIVRELGTKPAETGLKRRAYFADSFVPCTLLSFPV